jgi:hypothetical protein
MAGGLQSGRGRRITRGALRQSWTGFTIKKGADVTCAECASTGIKVVREHTLKAFTVAIRQLRPGLNRFKRMFSYYLNACAGAFRARDIQLWQVVFSRGVEGGATDDRKLKKKAHQRLF